MDGFDRIYDLHRILKRRRVAVPLADILGEMECSRATFNRIKRHMTDFLGAPIVYDREQGGYCYQEDAEHGYELPGIWLKEEELRALLLIRALIENLGAGILSDQLYPIEQRVNQLLKNNALNPERLQQRIRLLGMATRAVDPAIFTAISEAVMQRHALSICHEGAQGAGQRVISPQRILHYRHNWYLDAWCHLRKKFRTFAVDAITEAHPAAEAFVEISDEDLDAQVLGSYGLYPADNIQHCRVRVLPPLAARVAREQWHPEQTVQVLANGSIELCLPFNGEQPHELLMDILRLGPAAEILEPPSLRQQLHQQLTAMVAVYRD